MAHAGGRPPKYTRTIVKQVHEYLDSCTDEYVKLKGSRAKRLQVKLPSIEGLAMYLRVAKSTIYDWKKAYPEFSYAIEIVEVAQADRALNGGMSGMYNSRISGMLLSSKHGYVPKSETREVDDWDDLLNKADASGEADEATDTEDSASK
jgi:hypothetical protein